MTPAERAAYERAIAERDALREAHRMLHARGLAFAAELVRMGGTNLDPDAIDREMVVEAALRFKRDADENRAALAKMGGG